MFKVNQADEVKLDQLVDQVTMVDQVQWVHKVLLVPWVLQVKLV